MPPTQALFDLQGIDLELDLRDSRLEEIRRLLGDDRELRVMRHEAARLRATVKASSAAQAELDQTVAGFTSHIEQVEAKLYGGHVTLSRELQDLQADAAMIKRQRGVEEDKLLVVLVDLEQAETGLKEARDRLAAAQAAWDADQASMTEEHGALEREVADLRSQRASRAPRFPRLSSRSTSVCARGTRAGPWRASTTARATLAGSSCPPDRRSRCARRPPPRHAPTADFCCFRSDV